jgi:hypothetical protein
MAKEVLLTAKVAMEKNSDMNIYMVSGTILGSGISGKCLPRPYFVETMTILVEAVTSICQCVSKWRPRSPSRRRCRTYHGEYQDEVVETDTLPISQLTTEAKDNKDQRYGDQAALCRN